jgi:type I restriction enzyme M protein
MGKTNALNDDDLAEFVNLQKKKSETPKSWSVDVATLNQDTFDLSTRNPNAPGDAPLVTPEAILAEIAELDAESAEVLKGIKALL